VEWIGTIVCVGLQTEQVRKECVWGRGEVCVGSKAKQEQAMVFSMEYEMEWHCTLGSQTEQECVLSRRQSKSIKWIQNSTVLWVAGSAGACRMDWQLS
jgi:hypothetical protein